MIVLKIWNTKIKEKIDFMNKRAAHYDEFKVLKALRGDEADDDDVSGAQRLVAGLFQGVAQPFQVRRSGFQQGG